MTEREMKQRKAAARKARERKARNRRVLTTVALMLVVCVASIGGTIAWLTDKTEVVTNTFSSSNIDIWMTESVPDGGDEGTERDVKTTKDGQAISNDEFQIIPGGSQTKDPKVVVEKGSEPCWVFVQVTETGGATGSGESATAFDTFISYTVDTTNWTALGDSYPGIYYKKLDSVSATADVELNVLEDAQVTYPETITKANMDALETAGSQQQLKLTFQAYAIQSANLKDGSDNAITGDDETAAAKAWVLAKPSGN